MVEDINAEFFGEPEGEEQEIDERTPGMDDIKSMTDEYVELYARRKRLEQALEETMRSLARVDEALVRAFENANLKNARVNGVGLFSSNTQEYVSINDGAEEEAYQWLKNHGGDWMIKPSVHYQRLRSFVLKIRDNEKEDIPDCFKVSPVTKIRFTPAKK